MVEFITLLIKSVQLILTKFVAGNRQLSTKRKQLLIFKGDHGNQGHDDSWFKLQKKKRMNRNLIKELEAGGKDADIDGKVALLIYLHLDVSNVMECG